MTEITSSMTVSFKTTATTGTAHTSTSASCILATGTTSNGTTCTTSTGTTSTGTTGTTSTGTTSTGTTGTTSTGTTSTGTTSTGTTSTGTTSTGTTSTGTTSTGTTSTGTTSTGTTSVAGTTATTSRLPQGTYSQSRTPTLLWYLDPGARWQADFVKNADPYTWLNTSYATAFTSSCLSAIETVYAHANSPVNQSSATLMAAGFGFNVPYYAQIMGVSVTLNRRTNLPTSVYDIWAGLIQGGVAQNSSNLCNDTGCSIWFQGTANYTFGGATHLWNGFPFSGDTVSNPGFGFGIKATNRHATNNGDYYIDLMVMTVYYAITPTTGTTAPTTGTTAPTSTGTTSTGTTSTGTTSTGTTGPATTARPVTTASILTTASMSTTAGYARPVNRTRTPWVTYGGDLLNSRWFRNETMINSSTVQNLVLKWVNRFNGGVLAAPTIDSDGVLYTADWGYQPQGVANAGGTLWAINSWTGQVIWSVKIGDLIEKNFPGFPTTIEPSTRTSPLIYGPNLYIGTSRGAFLCSFSKSNGSLNWMVQLDTHTYAVITQSLVVYNDTIYAGTASFEERAAIDGRGFKCCTFRGSFGAYRISNGSTIWKMRTVPDNGNVPGGYAGAGVWGSAPPIDLKRNSIFIGTGNAYSVPQNVSNCVLANPWNRTTQQAWIDGLNPCYDQRMMANAIISLDMMTGAVKWWKSFGPSDPWNFGCVVTTVDQKQNCNYTAGPDSDFGQMPIIIRGSPRTPNGQDILLAPQKSGILWGLNPDNGDILYNTDVGPSGLHGGMEWGSSADDRAIYMGEANVQKYNATLLNDTRVDIGYFAAVNYTNGKLLWTTPPPDTYAPYGPTAIANGVMFGTTKQQSPGTNNGKGSFYALDAITGAVKFSFTMNWSSACGMTVSDGWVYVGAGGGGYGDNSLGGWLYAFALPDA
eukprot:TRINITY_DN1776_c1_g3_i1.p1 TRINITY_DN1776_c1_g3~~TRINITY_DN1776_c1_g3_i1.p1  ORF type:complete len:929 (+),score=282.46 TRINITY_DN1776_c1_g3_i1:26-2788(+)